MNEAYEHIVSTDGLSHEKWLEYRRTGIGGSDASKVINLSDYGNPASVYLDKKGDLEPIEETLRLWLGTAMEPVIAARFTLETGFKLERYPWMCRSKEYPWMLANPDYIGTDDVGKKFVFECKTAELWMKHLWEDEGAVPKDYVMQVYHYLIVMNLDYAYIACLIGFNIFVYVKIERDAKFERYLANAEKEFWSDVENNVLPRIDASDGSRDLLTALFPRSIQDVRDLEPDEVSWAVKRGEWVDKKKVAENEIQKYSNFLKAKLGEIEIGQARVSDTEMAVVKWKEQATNSFDEKLFIEQNPRAAALVLTQKVDRKKLKLMDPKLYHKYVGKSRRFDVNIVHDK